MPDEPKNLDNEEQLVELTEEISSSQAEISECPNCSKMQAEAAEYKSGWQRAVADYKNLQKETSERRQLLLEMSEQQILEEFIPVYDNFKKAFAHHPEVAGDNEKQLKNWISGIGHIQRQFGEVMKAHKVEEIKTVGEKFDPKFHEAAGEEVGEGEPGTILREVDGGYVMGERVIKAAKVIIAQ